ncbi:flavodoxin [Treponema brennaborense]|nr:flavodoxin [Treponema brennaborense]
MKRFFAVILSGGLLMAGVSAKTLVVYYSYSETGNTRRIAEQIQKETGADIAEIVPVVPYSNDYDAVVDAAKRDVNRDYKPEIRKLGVNVGDYDTIVIGTPTWWYKMASPVLTFMSGTDFSGTHVALFSTHAGWSGTVIADMSALCKGADVFAAEEIQFGTRAKAGTLVTKQAVVDEFIRKIRERR